MLYILTRPRPGISSIASPIQSAISRRQLSELPLWRLLKGQLSQPPAVRTSLSRRSWSSLHEDDCPSRHHMEPQPCAASTSSNRAALRRIEPRCAYSLGETH